MGKKSMLRSGGVGGGGMRVKGVRGKGNIFVGTAQKCQLRGEKNVPVFRKFGSQDPKSQLFSYIIPNFQLKIYNLQKSSEAFFAFL